MQHWPEGAAVWFSTSIRRPQKCCRPPQRRVCEPFGTTFVPVQAGCRGLLVSLDISVNQSFNPVADDELGRDPMFGVAELGL